MSPEQKLMMMVARLALLLCLPAVVSGCGKQTGGRADQQASEASKRNPGPAERLQSAREAFTRADNDNAAESVRNLLLQQPENRDAVLLAAEIEAARGNPAIAIEFAQSIPLDDRRLGEQAAKLRFAETLKLENDAATEIALRDLISVAPSTPKWRRELMLLLNRQGRRKEACEQADQLCRLGQASATDLRSLIRREQAFPRKLVNQQEPADVFAAGMGLARWWFTSGEYAVGLREIEKELLKPQQSPEVIALYGRLLAENQSLERMPDWHLSCEIGVQEHADYWAALGAFFIQTEQFEPAARALLEAVQRNPTDRVCFQRLGQVMDALDRPEDAKQFRYQAVEIANSEIVGEKLRTESVVRGELLQSMMRSMLALSRPFEALGWASLDATSHSPGGNGAIEAQRKKLLAIADLESVTIEAALREVDPNDFDIGEAILRAFGSSQTDVAVFPRPKQNSVLAVPHLVNVAAARGADFQWFHEPEINLDSIPLFQSLGGGIAVIDYDHDGWPDLYFAQGSGTPPEFNGTRSNQLLRNVEGTFHDVTESSSTTDHQYSSGLAAGDVNQDGFLDLVVGNLGENSLLINNGDGTFVDASLRLGAHDDRFTASLAVADITGDSLPEIYESTYVEMEGGFDPPAKMPDGREAQPGPLLHYAASDRWFQSIGDGSFQPHDIDNSVAEFGTGLGVIICDFDGSIGNEILIGNDLRPNHLLTYAGELEFRDIAAAKGLAFGSSGAANGCMGIASGDFNRDGRLDVQIANFLNEPANLYLQTVSGGFVDGAVKFGVASATQAYVGFGTKALDIDRNGWLDFLTTNGHIFDMQHAGEPYKMSPQLLMGIGSRYVSMDPRTLSEYFRGEYLGRSMAMLDFDRDGSIDFVIGHLDFPTALLRNETETDGKWVQFELIGTISERDAVGAEITVTTAENGQFKQWVTAGDGYFATDEPVIDIGLGKASGIKQVAVRWPSGETQVFKSILIERRYLLVENDPEPFPR